MVISKIRLYSYDREFEIPFHSSHVMRTRPDSVICILECNNGIAGYGESTPRPYVTGEDCGTVVKYIRDIFTPFLLGRRVESLEDAEFLLNEIEEKSRESGCGPWNSALGAVDLALLDALGKHTNRSVASYLGPRVRDSIIYSFSVPFLPMDKIESIIHRFGSSRFRYIKVLVGPSEKENIERLRSLRSLLGKEVDIRIEANGRISPEESLRNCEVLKPFDISAIEQPVAPGDIPGMARFREQADIPVIADESLCTMDDAVNLIENKACDIINIKISKCGGLLRSRAIARYAASHGVECQMGAHVGETAILSEAGRAFALTTPGLRYVEGGSSILFQEQSEKLCCEENLLEEEPGLGLKDTDCVEILKDSSLRELRQVG